MEKHKKCSEISDKTFKNLQQNFKEIRKKYLKKENTIKYDKAMLGYVQENLGKFCEDFKSI